MNKLFFASIIFSVSAFQSCTYESVEPKRDDLVIDSLISYSRTIAPLTKDRCESCHGSGSPDGDFSNYTGLKSVAGVGGQLYDRVVSKKDMPQIGSGIILSDVERKYYEAWIKQGAPNN